jgi:hypothetical protein
VLQSFANSSATLNGWAIVDQGTLGAPSNWQVLTTGVLKQSSDIRSTDSAKLGTFAKYTAGSTWQNVGIKVELNSTDNDVMGVMFRVVDNQNYYRLSWNVKTGLRQLERIVNGEASVMAEDHATIAGNTWYRLAIYAIDNKLTVFVDGQSVFSVNDSTHQTGTVALYSFDNDGARFRNLTVRDLN